MPTRKFGWIPDVPDPIRDWKFSSVAKKVRIYEDKPIDLRPLCPEVEDQGNLGSCVSCGCVGLCEFLEIKDNNPNFKDLSRLFVYYWARDLDSCANIDEGATIRDGFKSLDKYGVCAEATWQYIEENVNVKPTDISIEEAKPHIISEYARLNSVEDMINCLIDGYPFVFGLTLYDSFESDQTEKTGIVTMPQDNENPTGGHCMMCVGWLPETQQFIVRNSWGTNFGKSGYCFIPKEYMNPSNDFCDDIWTARKFSFVE